MTAGFSLAQSRALALLPKFSGGLSVLFSSFIVLTVARDKRKRNRTYHRLLCGISFVDISSSFWLGLSTLPMVNDGGDVLWAVGNDQTCRLQGFFTEFGVASSFYNASLSIYFLLVIRYGWKEARIQKMEPFLHAVPLLWGFGTSATALGMGVLGNATLWCWIEPQYDVFRWVLFYGPLWIMIGIVTGASILIYQYVRQLTRVSQRFKYDHSYEYPHVVSSEDNQRGEIRSVMVRSEVSKEEVIVDEVVVRSRSSVVQPLDEKEDSPVTNSKESGKRPQDETTLSEMSNNSDVERTRAEQLERVRSAQCASHHHDPSPSRSLPQGESRRFSFFRRLSADFPGKNRREKVEAYRKRTHEVAWQCLWYSFAFYINWLALSVSRKHTPTRDVIVGTQTHLESSRVFTALTRSSSLPAHAPLANHQWRGILPTVAVGSHLHTLAGPTECNHLSWPKVSKA